MSEYMPKVGSRGLDMMTRTCTVQANLDYFNETDLIKKFVVSNRIQPIVMGIFCNSPFRESKYNNLVSNRIYTWQDTDDQRCGIKRSFLNKNFSIEEYVDFVLEVKNYFLKINGKQYDTTDYTFNELLTKNTANKDLSNYNISIQDWINHLSTIFTEVRLKSYIELRGADAGKWEMICALPAFWVGILYDDENIEHLWKETSSWQENDILNLYLEVPYKGLNSNFINSPLYEHGKNLLNLANKGLEKRGYLNSEGRDESIHLEKLYNIVEKQKNPADLLIEEFKDKKDILSLLNNTYY